MDVVNVFAVFSIVVVSLYLLFQLGFWRKIVGIEYFEEKYAFQKPVNTKYVRDLFISLDTRDYDKRLTFNLNVKCFYSIGHSGLDDWSSWLPLENKPIKDFGDYDIRYRDAWTIHIFGPDLYCTVYHDDSTLFYEDESYPEIRLVGLGIVKFPWNIRKIKKERKFLQDMVFFLKEAEQKYTK
jgi:hypothetical protein